MKTIEIRKRFIEFFQQKNHKYYESAPLVPNDTTVLFTVAGMIPFKPFFLGNKISNSKRAVSCQKCIRTNDIENIGMTKRHLSFFEMLGNFSFGDYFKEDAISFAWEFITEVLKIDREKLVVTVYENDEEAFYIWYKKIGLKKERIKKLGKEYNFWESGSIGPCGPCSEIYYCYEDPENFDQDSENYFEFWNLVFIQYNKIEDGSFKELPSKSIDTGMGLERLARLLQNKDSNFEIDNIYPIIQEIERISGLSYRQNVKAFRIITDHLRSSIFLILDGVLPSNEKRGYVLRRLMRRLFRYSLNANLKDLSPLVDKVSEIMSITYNELIISKEYIKNIIKEEERKFSNVLVRGLEFLKEEVENLNSKEISPKVVFKLYETYGFPFELTKELCEDEGIKLDEKKFRELLEQHQNLSRNYKVERLDISNDEIHNIYKKYGSTEFLGYSKLQENAEILEILSSNEIILDRTVFYAESGGQMSDFGTLENENFIAEVVDVRKIKDIIIHKLDVKKGIISKGDIVILKVDKDKREATKRNHSAVHLLHAALKKVLGENVKQSGSLVNSEIGRLDFLYSTSLTDDQISEVENIVNSEILKNYEVFTHVKHIDEANKMGAVSLFEEKYGDIVRVIQMNNFSLEFCGGTHISRTGEIGTFKITSEKGIGSGIRRIELTTGKNLKKYLDKIKSDLSSIGNLLETSQDKIADKLKNILEENLIYKLELNKLKKNVLQQKILHELKDAESVKGTKLIVMELDEDSKILKEIFNIIISRNIPLALVVGFKNRDVGLIINGFNINAVEILKKCFKKVEGKGGGKVNIAQGRIEIPFKDFIKVIKEIISQELD